MQVLDVDFAIWLNVKMGCMHQGPRVEQCPIAIQFFATYVIVMGVSNHMAMKLAYGPVHRGYIKTHI